jgi:hypothetical protein
MTLRYLGIPANNKSYMLGDNQVVVTNSAIPHSPLNKRHNALAYHRVRWATNKCILHLLQPVLFYTINTNDVLVSEQNEKSTSMEKEEHPTILSNL